MPSSWEPLFQRIASPEPRLSNLLLLVAFGVVMDGWLLYHAQAAKLGQGVRESPGRLILDMIILLIWYAAAC
jgi:hypothetical protein